MTIAGPKKASFKVVIVALCQITHSNHETEAYVFHTYIACAHTHSAVVLQNYYQITCQGWPEGVQAAESNSLSGKSFIN
jgi:hypothetical protein